MLRWTESDAFRISVRSSIRLFFLSVGGVSHDARTEREEFPLDVPLSHGALRRPSEEGSFLIRIFTFGCERYL